MTDNSNPGRFAPLVALAAAIVALLGSSQAHADTITVNTGQSGVVNDGQCSFHEALESANTDMPVGGCTAGGGADSIVFSGVSAITSTQAPPTITTPITLEGAGVRLVLSGTLVSDHQFQIGPTGALTMTRVNLDGINCQIFSRGALALRSSTITGCGSTPYGTIINLGGRMWVSDTLFLLNGGYQRGGAITNEYGDVHVENSTFRQNYARSGAAIFNGVVRFVNKADDITSTLYVTHSLFVANELGTGADYGKGVITNYGNATVHGNVFAGNKTSPLYSTGVVDNGGAITLTNNLFRDNDNRVGPNFGPPNAAHAAISIYSDDFGMNRGTIMRNNTIAQPVGVMLNFYFTSIGVLSAPVTATIEYNTFVNASLVLTDRSPIEVYTHTTALMTANVFADLTSSQNCRVDGGVLSDQGRNFSNDGSCAFGGTGSQNNAQPGLGSLTDTSQRVGASGDGAFLQVFRPSADSPLCATRPCAGAVPEPAAQTPTNLKLHLPVVRR